MRILFGLVPLLVGGCAQWGEQLYVAHDIKIGLDASVNTATTSGSVDLGYDRRFLTFVPRSVAVREQESETLEGGAEAAAGETASSSEQAAEAEPSMIEVSETGEGTSLDAKEVMSVMACSRLSVSVWTIDYYDESLATGRAAVRFADALARDRAVVSEDYFDCFKRRDRAQEQFERKQRGNEESGGGDGS